MENHFQESVKKELKSMDQRLYDLEEKMTSIDTKLTQVVDAILGNPLTKSGGFINDIEVLKTKIIHLEKMVEKHDDFKKKVYWLSGAAMAILLIVQYLSSIYGNILK
jgi:uncharacterized protein YdcH (DUF465 family)